MDAIGACSDEGKATDEGSHDVGLGAMRSVKNSILCRVNAQSDYPPRLLNVDKAVELGHADEP